MDYNEMYESFKKDPSYEIDIIEGVQYNFKLDDIQRLLNVNDLLLFKKYLYYLNNFRINNLFLESNEDALKKFILEVDEEENIKNKIINIFLKHENLFCDEDGIKKLKYVPKEYQNRIFNCY